MGALGSARLTPPLSARLTTFQILAHRAPSWEGEKTASTLPCPKLPGHLKTKGKNRQRSLSSENKYKLLLCR